MAGPIDPRLLRRARATKGYLVAGLAVGLVTAILVLGQGWLLSQVIVEVIRSPRVDVVYPLSLLLTVFAARAVLAWGNQVLAHRSAAAVKSQLRADIFAARAANPGALQPTGPLVTLVTRGLDALDGYYGKYLPQLGLAMTVPFVVGAAVLWADWVSAVILALTIPLIPLFMVLIGWKTQERVDASWASHNRLARHFADLIAGLPTLQVFGRAAAQADGVARNEERYRRSTMSTLRWSFLSSMALELLSTLSMAVVAVGIGLRVVYGEMDFQLALFVLIIAPEAYLPLRMVGIHYHDSTDGQAAATDAFAVIDAPGAPASGSATVRTDVDTLRVDGLQHSYGAGPTAQPCSFDVEPGHILALTGPSGAGKTTILNALMGFLTPTSGTVRIGGQPLSDVDLTAWRRQIAYVGQTPAMVNGTVADNVLLGTDADVDAARVALDRAGAADLPLDQAVGDDGEGLSGGERRRVAMARALLRLDAGATLLLVDEPTAGLDADAEATVIDAIREAGVSALIVSHRPRVLAAADHVIEVLPC